MKKKKSGNDYRKIAIQNAKEAKKCSNSIADLFSKKRARFNEHVDEVFEEAHSENIEKTSEEEVEKVNEEEMFDEGHRENIEKDNEEVVVNGDNISKESNKGIECVLNLDKNVVVNYDPGLWGDLNDAKRIKLVERGPIKILKKNDEFPRKKYGERRRSFSCKHYVYEANGVTNERRWLVYSDELDKVFCFCCKLFKDKAMKTNLVNGGSDDWHNISQKLRDHEASIDHIMYTIKWMDLAKGLKLEATIDHARQKLIAIEKSRWILVLIRIIGVVKVLARNSLPFRGTKEKIYEKDNGLFCQLIEFISEFDVVMEEHLRRVVNNEINHHYLSHKIQNELISILANEIKKIIIQKVKKAKYYSVILDCTPDLSHVEQMSIIIRCVDIEGSKVNVEEFFLGFIKVNDTTGLGLFESLRRTLDDLKLDFMDIRGQGYDNGSNMKGKHQGVQIRVIKENPRALYVSCGCHSLNLALVDMAKSCSIGRDFFVYLQKIYNLISGSPQRWEILREKMGKYTVKTLSTTRWESHIESVRAIKTQAPLIRNVLIEIANASKKDDVARAEAKGLCKHVLEDFGFLISLCVWYKILDAINEVSKVLQEEEMNMEMAIIKINGLIDFFKILRNDGFEDLLNEAKELALKIGIEPCFPQKRIIRRPVRFDDEEDDDIENQSPVEKFRVNFFVYVIDQALESLEERFTQFRAFEDTFGFLFGAKLKNKSDENLLACCKKLESFLKHGEHYDVYAMDLFADLQNLKMVLPIETTTAIGILDFIKSYSGGGVFFESAWIAYRILLTTPVSVASAERSFSKLKLIKNYLRTTMSQERLSGLAMIAIEKELLDSLKYDKIIEEFASNNAKRTQFV